LTPFWVWVAPFSGTAILAAVTPAIPFRRERRLARLHDPRRGFAAVEVESEIRWDPLTGETSRICHFALPQAPPADLGPVVEARRASCPFCPGRVTSVTPRFPDDLVPGGRFVRGPAVVFPNLFPYDDLSAIAVPGPEHLVSAANLPEPLVVSGVAAARDFLRLVLPRLPTGRDLYGLVTWNHMPPAGGTQIHPHLQVVATSEPGNALRRQLAAEAAWHRTAGRPFAEALLAEEDAAGRRVGASGPWQWLVPFAPTGVLGDCRAVLPGAETLLDLDDDAVAAFAAGLRRALAGFAEVGIWSFNLTFLPGRFGGGGGHHWLEARLLPRLWLDPSLHVPDASYLQLLLGERFSMAWPEEVAARLRAAFHAPGA
jgi:UDPglucose--hexose-1-phosphate uridylyltransferase